MTSLYFICICLKMSAMFIIMICTCPTILVSRQNLHKNISYFYTCPLYLLSVLIASAVFKNVEKFGYLEHNSFKFHSWWNLDQITSWGCLWPFDSESFVSHNLYTNIIYLVLLLIWSMFLQVKGRMLNKGERE